MKDESKMNSFLWGSRVQTLSFFLAATLAFSAIFREKKAPFMLQQRFIDPKGFWDQGHWTEVVSMFWQKIKDCHTVKTQVQRAKYIA